MKLLLTFCHMRSRGKLLSTQKLSYSKPNLQAISRLTIVSHETKKQKYETTDHE